MEFTRTDIRILHIIQPMRVEDFKRLKASGARDISVFRRHTIIQDTNLCILGPKADYEWRLATGNRGRL
jgi:hypothetical protein